MNAQTLIKTILLTVLRALLVWVGGDMVKKGWITLEQAGKLTSPEVLTALGGAIMFGGTVLYSVIRTKVFHKAIVDATQGNQVKDSKITSIPKQAQEQAIGQPVASPAFKNALFWLLGAFLAGSVVGCAHMAHFDQNTFSAALELKSEALPLVLQATDRYELHKAQVEALQVKLSAQLAYEEGKGKSNVISYNQWRILTSEDHALLGKLLKDWKEEKKFSPAYVREKAEQIGLAFDEIMRLEGAKPK